MRVNGEETKEAGVMLYFNCMRAIILIDNEVKTYAV